MPKTPDPPCGDCGHPKSDHFEGRYDTGRCDHDVDADWNGERYIRISGCDCEGWDPA